MPQQVPTPSLTGLNNSVIIRSSRFDIDQHTSVNTLYNMFKQDSFLTNIGMLYLWNRRKLMNTPLLMETELKNNVIYVNGQEGKLRYGIPYELEFPQVSEDISGDSVYIGRDNQKFKIKLTEPFSNTDIITSDWRDGIPLAVTEEEIYEEGGSYVHTVMIPLTYKKDIWYPKELLQPGTEYMKITNFNAEYEEQKSSIMNKTGAMELEVQLGAGRSVYHWITGAADMLSVDDAKLQWMNHYGDVNSAQHVINIMDKDQYGNPIPKSNRWIRMIEALLFAEIKMMEERDLTWNKGGMVQGSGRRLARVNTGYYEQCRDGNRIGFDRITLDLIDDALANLYWNSGIPVEDRHTIFDVGTAAMIEISKLLADDFNRNVPFIVNADSGALKNMIYGSGPMNLGYGFRFTSKRFPVGGLVEFRINPALDNRNNRSDGLYGEWPIESYTMMIKDVLDKRNSNIAGKAKLENGAYTQAGYNENSNIVLIKPKNWGETYWGYEIGTFHPFGPKASQGMFGTSQRPGYGMWAQNWSSIWMKDPGRSVLLEKNRPSYWTP